MKGIFVNKRERIKVNFVIGQTKKGECVAALDDKSFEEKDEVSSIEEHYVEFKRPSYRDNVETFSKTLRVEGQNMQIDPALLRYERFCTLISDWSFTKDDGSIYKPTRENIDNLNPDIANVIMDGLDRELEEANN